MPGRGRNLDHRAIRRAVRRTGLAIALLLGLVVPAAITGLVLANAHGNRVENAHLAAEAVTGHIYETRRIWRFQIERAASMRSRCGFGYDTSVASSPRSGRS